MTTPSLWCIKGRERKLTSFYRPVRSEEGSYARREEGSGLKQWLRDHAIGLTLLLQIPINYVIRTLANQEGIRAFLPPGAGGILIALCVLLNMIGGFIPARKAARQDPVEALRSE